MSSFRITVDLCKSSGTKLAHFQTRSAYHLNGIFGNSGTNSNGTVHPGGKFSEKGNTFRGISFFPLLPEFPEISVPMAQNGFCFKDIYLLAGIN